MRKIALALILMTSTAHAQGLLELVPSGSESIKGSFRSLAECAYLRLDQTGLKKVDLSNEVRLALDAGSSTHWQLIFRPAGKNETIVEFSRMRTIWGPLGGSEIMPAVRACAS